MCPRDTVHEDAYFDIQFTKILKKVGKNAAFVGFKITITSTSALVYFRVKIVSFNTKPIAKYSKIISAFKQSKYIIYKPWSTNEHK